MKQNRQPNPDDSVGFFHSGARSRAGGEWQETRQGGGARPPGGPFAIRDPPRGCTSSWRRAPCSSRADKGLGVSCSVLFFSHSSLGFSTEIQFLSISKIFFCLRCPGVPSPALPEVVQQLCLMLFSVTGCWSSPDGLLSS